MDVEYFLRARFPNQRWLPKGRLRLQWTRNERLRRPLPWWQEVRRNAEEGVDLPRKTDHKWLPVLHKRRALGVPHAGDTEPAELAPTHHSSLCTRDL